MKSSNASAGCDRGPASQEIERPQSLIGRQPIFDRDGHIQAYELLFRSVAPAAGRPFDGNHATANVIVNALTEFGLDNLVGPHRAFINFTADMLRDDTVRLLPRERVVIEILEDIAIDDKLVESVAAMARDGYELALDDFVFRPEWKPLIRLASTIKIDVLALDAERVATYAEQFKAAGLTILAEKVETHDQHQQMLDLGFDLFQGYHYAKPKVLARDRIPDDHMATLRLLAAVNDPSVSMDDLEALVVQLWNEG